MSSFSSNAILAKARSMYSHRLTEEDYEELLKKRNLDELVSYLKSETIYGKALNELKENHVRRKHLESLLNKEIFLRLDRLMRYASKKELKFYQLGVTELEIQLIMTKIRLLVSQYHDDYVMDIPQYLNKYSSFELYELIRINNYEDLLSLMKGTKYYDLLLKYQPTDEKIDLNMLELDFKHIYYKEYVETIDSLFKGKRKENLMTMFDTSNELQNITKIYRLKKYFNASPSQIRETLFLEHTRIPRRVLNQMIEAKDAEDFLKQLASSSYKLYIDDSDFVYIEYHTERIKYYLAKRFLRFSTDSALVYMTYKIVYQIEIDNLKHIIEGIRYGESPDQIRSMLIY